KHESDDLLVILNVAPVPKWDWQIQITGHKYEKEIFNSDLQKYWGSGNVTNPDIRMEEISTDEGTEDSSRNYRLLVNLPPLAAIVLK
ncbi:MAG: alpha amylase C-terminal domain-containing protein, partial [Flavisolibacter sp.]